MLPLKPPYNRPHFIHVLPSPNICTFSDKETFLHPYLIFSALLNLNLLTWRTPKFKVLQILPGALFPTQIEPKEPKRSWINPHLDNETGVDILQEDAAYRCFDLAHTDLAHFFKSSQIIQPTSNHLERRVWDGGKTENRGMDRQTDRQTDRSSAPQQAPGFPVLFVSWWADTLLDSQISRFSSSSSCTTQSENRFSAWRRNTAKVTLVCCVGEAAGSTRACPVWWTCVWVQCTFRACHNGQLADSFTMGVPWWTLQQTHLPAPPLLHLFPRPE